MTNHQYGTMKYLLHNNVYIQQSARSLSMVTFGSLAQRGWIKVNSGGIITLTDEGMEAYNAYYQAKANFRKVEKDISEHVRSLLHVGKLLSMKKAG